MAFLSSILALFGALFGWGGSVSATPHLPVVMTCEVSGPAASQVQTFTDAVCVEARQQLATATGYEVVLAESSAESSAASPRVSIILTINTPYAAKAQAKWGGGPLPAGESPVYDTGSEDAPLGVVGAAQLAMVLIGQIPL